MILIKTQRLHLKTIDEKDIPFLLKIYNNEENMRFISSGKFDWTHTELYKKYSEINKDYRLGIGIYCLQRIDDGKIIGEAGLFNSFNDLTKLELGYIIDSEFWNQGFGKEVCLGLINYAFNKLGTSALIARMYANNISSVKLSESCNMKKINEEIMNNKSKVYVYEINNH